MELFPDEAHVRLRSRAHGTYLHAEEDGVGVTLRLRRASLNQAWAVHRLARGGTSYVLLHGAAYGRYLALVRDDDAQEGQDSARRACRAVQRVYDAPGQEDVLFEVVWAEDGSGDVLMRHCTFGGWRNFNNQRTMMSWVVEAIPPREDPPELPPVIPPLPVAIGGPVRRRRVVHQPVFRRIIQYVRADDQGHVNNLVWRMFWFDGRSVSHLRGDLANELAEENPHSITLCVWAGSQGRRTPLVTDLPANEQTMDIVVLATESAAAEALVYPNVGAL
uniref:DUF569 domain-containing protein n=1 Tax=Setaria viridis TaxID=4556 RepID=A0A4U6UZ04_SETVI|nr:uncharacterized protein LOC117853348 [Setaria viridis]TKW20093.1 hypothetical protein SEVIR_4G062800v2 [Setaria viridis]